MTNDEPQNVEVIKKNFVIRHSTVSNLRVLRELRGAIKKKIFHHEGHEGENKKTMTNDEQGIMNVEEKKNFMIRHSAVNKSFFAGQTS